MTESSRNVSEFVEADEWGVARDTARDRRQSIIRQMQARAAGLGDCLAMRLRNTV